MSYPLKKIILTLLGVGFSLVGCGENTLEYQSISNSDSGLAQQEIKETVTEKVIDITVSIAPQKYFLEKIGGDRLKINVMVDPKIEPEIYEPKPQELTNLSQTKAYITIGLPFEKKWLDKFKEVNAQMVIIDSTKGIEFMEMDDHGHDHSHDLLENYDPHIWLSPSLVKIQAQNIYEGLASMDPENQEFYQNNLTIFLTEIDQLDQQIRANLEGIKTRKFIVFHPSWGYFAQEYNLTQIPVELDGKEPSAAQLAKVISEAKEHNIKVVFAQPEFKEKSAETIAQEIEGKVIILNPNNENWADNLLNVSQIFKENL
jgi:zinc transport system substrate-binding protein